MLISQPGPMAFPAPAEQPTWHKCGTSCIYEARVRSTPRAFQNAELAYQPSYIWSKLV